MDDPARPDGDEAEPTPTGSVDEAEEMARIAESLSALIGRMAEFQKEMEPFLTLLAEPDLKPDERPGTAAGPPEGAGGGA